MGSEEDTFNRLRKWPIYDFRAWVISHPWDFVGDRKHRDHECAIRGWTWVEYVKEFNRLNNLGLIL